MESVSSRVSAESFYNLICRHANIGCWSFCVPIKQIWFSDVCCDLLGITCKDGLPDLVAFLDNTVHPADRYAITKAIKKILYHGILLQKTEVRIKNHYDVYHWFEIVAEAKYDETESIQYVFGSIANIDEKKIQQEESKRLNFFVEVVDKMMGIGMLEINFLTDELYFSRAVYDILEVPADTPVRQMRRADFLEEKDVKRFDVAMTALQITKKPYDLEVRITTAKKNTCWVHTMAKPIIDDNGNVTGLLGTVQKIEKEKLKENFLLEVMEKIKEQKFFLNETSAMSDVGGWEMNFETNVLFWSEQTKLIHGVDTTYSPSFEKAVNFYTSSSYALLQKHFSALTETGNPFDLELEMLTASTNVIWVRVIGKPVYHLGKIIIARGVIQNITKQKHREIELENALNIINEQNDKLKDFTYIVSHNLRSHAGNLKMITEMVEIETDLEVKLEWIDLIKNVSTSLSQTVNNLNGLVNLNIEGKKRLWFSEIFGNIQKGLNYKIVNEDVEITTDFSGCEWVDYVPAYLESIMLNLITNAIKYKHPARKPVISLLTAFANNRPLLKVKDNGLGIDLTMYGSRIFKMNQTFHQNSDARGIGLYITRNQVEAMGGTIEVDSIVNEGTTFTVHF